MKILNTYICKDNRVRAYCDDDGIKKIVSYPRILMVQKLGRPLKPYEDVHHKDENPLNNDLDNLEIVIHGEHQRQHHPNKYFDIEAVCDVCGKKFIWTAKRQSCYYQDIKRNKKRIITCSRNCSSFYGRQEQLNRNI